MGGQCNDSEKATMMVGTNSDSDTILEFINPNTDGIELGVWKGHSSKKFFLRGVKSLQLVDSWSVAPYTNSTEFPGGMEEYLNRYRKTTGGSTIEDFTKFYDLV